MNIKTELLKSFIADYINNRIDNFEIDANINRHKKSLFPFWEKDFLIIYLVAFLLLIPKLHLPYTLTVHHSNRKVVNE